MDASLPVTSLICRRALFDQMLFEAAREKVEVIDRCAVREVLVEDGRACGVVAERGADDLAIRAGAVIGADGARSTVARQMGVARRPEHRTAFARAYYRMVVGPAGSLEVHFLEDLLPGYVWIYPTESGMTNVGLAAACGALRLRRTRGAHPHGPGAHRPHLAHHPRPRLPARGRRRRPGQPLQRRRGGRGPSFGRPTADIGTYTEGRETKISYPLAISQLLTCFHLLSAKQAAACAV